MCPISYVEEGRLIKENNIDKCFVGISSNPYGTDVELFWEIIKQEYNEECFSRVPHKKEFTDITFI